VGDIVVQKVDAPINLIEHRRCDHLEGTRGCWESMRQPMTHSWW